MAESEGRTRGLRFAQLEVEKSNPDTGARKSLDGTAARTALKELLVEQPDINAAAAAPLIDRSPSYTRPLLAELRSEGA